MRALEEEIVSSLEEADALERAEAEARERLGPYLYGHPSDSPSVHQHTTPTSPNPDGGRSARQALGVIGQGRSPIMSSVPEEATKQHEPASENAGHDDGGDGDIDHLRDAAVDVPTALKSKREAQRDSDGSSTMMANVWEDGERFWEMTVNQARRSLALEMERRERDRESRLESERWEF